MITSLLIKPAGPDCNLRCNYCFYRRKAGMFGGKTHRMSDEVLESVISQAMAMGVCTFSWQGGEPTMMGLDFFRKVVKLEIEYGWQGATVANALQTNGTLLNREWAEFLSEYKFLIGLSLDGPARFHDHYRKDSDGKGTHERILQTSKLLTEYGVEFNVLTLLNDRNVKDPDAIYDFMKENEFSFFQLVPCVEPGGKDTPANFSIDPDEYGDFLVRMFDRWVEDFPAVSIRDFDELLLHAVGRPPMTCIVSPQCGSYAVVEHNGDVFCCDFFVQSSHKLGNLKQTPLEELVTAPMMRDFAQAKSNLGDTCNNCPFLQHCFGGCQKHRVILGGELTDPSYFCRGYKKLFAHAAKQMPSLVERLKELGII